MAEELTLSDLMRLVEDMDAEDLAFYGRVRHGYAELVRAEPGRFTTIDTGGPKEAAERRVREVLTRLLELPA